MKTSRNVIFIATLLLFLPTCVFGPIPQTVEAWHGDSHGNFPDQACKEAYVVYAEADSWVSYACEMAEYDVDWSDECYNSHLALATAFEYMAWSCLGMSIQEFAF